MTTLGQECVQNTLFYNAKRPSPSPLSSRIAFFGSAGSKMDILLESGEGLFLTLRFAREWRAFLEGRAPARPPIGILDERCESCSDKPTPLCSQTLSFPIFRGGVKRPMGQLRRRNIYEQHAFYETKLTFRLVGKATPTKFPSAPRFARPNTNNSIFEENVTTKSY